MGRFVLFFLWIGFSVTAGFGQSHGLQFSSHEVVPEKRTSLHLTSTAPYCLDRDTEISFDLTFRPNLGIYFGYIIRLIGNNHQNIDIVYNQKLLNFNFVIGEAFSVFTIDSAALFGKWNRFAIRLNKKAGEAALYLNDRFVCKSKANFTGETCYRIYFGTNDFEGFQTIDIPPMNIKDIRITAGGKRQYDFPLAESQGTLCTDQVAKRTAAVKNPVWIKPRHQSWQQVQAFTTRGTPSLAFDAKNERLYFVGPDTLYQLSFRTPDLWATALSQRRDTMPAGNQSVYDTLTGKLLNFYVDERKVSVYDAAARTWNVDFSPNDLTVFWHANKFISPVDTSLYVVAGYGQLQYKNLVQRYHVASGQWEVLQPKGDFFMPRYMAALGTSAAGDTAYIIGGYGSNTGDQTINPKYNYDLLAYSVKTKTFKLIYHLKEPARNFVFANSLITDAATGSFYALTYPSDRFNSSLQLIRGSLTTPQYQLMGDSIPYAFYDVESFADLYYCPASKKLVAVTLYTSKKNITSVRVYTIDFPPNEIVPVAVVQSNGFDSWIYPALTAIVIAAGLLFLFFVRRKPRKASVDAAYVPAPVQAPTTISGTATAREAAAIYLFGQFDVFDKEGNDITSQFTPLLKELFLLILIYSLRDGKGITSEKLYEILWGDKSPKDARNNYSVNIVKLKAILEKTGDCHIGKEGGKLRFEILDNSIRIDYQQYVALTTGQPVINKVYVQQLLAIVSRGAFLPTIHYTWLDDIKSDVSGHIIDAFLRFIATADMAHEAELIVKLTNGIFFFDQLNEEALVYKCRCLILLGRHGMARDAYLKFTKEYHENYGHQFERSFSEITAPAP
jgi:two-component SAPR family response regulator